MKDDFIHDLIGNGGVRIAVIGTLAILSLFLFVEAASIAKNFARPGAPATDTITVNGQGQATVPPDVARVTFSVENRAATVSDAQAKTTTQANAALDFVKKQGIEEKDVKTLSYNISPQYSHPICPAATTICPPQPSSVVGYQVAQTVQITVRDLKSIGDLLAGLGNLEVQSLSGPDFALDDPTAGNNAARADAIAKAELQAKTLSAQLGVRLGKIVSFNESSGSYGMGGAMMGKTSSSPVIPAGENIYSSTVYITYEIR